MPVYVDGIFQPQPWVWPVPGGDNATEVVKTDNPLRYVSPLYRIVSSIAAEWESGNLPLPGGLMAQPAKLVEAIRLRAVAIAHCRDILDQQHRTAMGVSGG